MVVSGLSLSCGIRKLASHEYVSNRDHASLVRDAQKAWAKAPNQLGAFQPYSEEVDSIILSLAPVSKCALLRQPPEIGTRCGSAARRDLCGGPLERAVPTVTNHGTQGRCQAADRAGISVTCFTSKTNSQPIRLARIQISLCRTNGRQRAAFTIWSHQHKVLEIWTAPVWHHWHKRVLHWCAGFVRIFPFNHFCLATMQCNSMVRQMAD
jgi:hypothetical protein